NLKSERFQKELEKLKPDIAVVVAFRMLPKKVWNFPELGTFNLHASLLPDYRGAAPHNWALINGEKEIGVTTLCLDEKIATGKIIAQEKVAIAPNDNAGSLHDKLMVKGAELVDYSLSMIAKNEIRPRPQRDSGTPKTAPKLNKTNTRINWKSDVKEIYDFVR